MLYLSSHLSVLSTGCRAQVCNTPLCSVQHPECRRAAARGAQPLQQPPAQPGRGPRARAEVVPVPCWGRYRCRFCRRWALGLSLSASVWASRDDPRSPKACAWPRQCQPRGSAGERDSVAAKRGSRGATGGREEMRGEQREAAEGRERRGEVCASARAQCELSEGEGTASRGSEEAASVMTGGPKRWKIG